MNVIIVGCDDIGLQIADQLADNTSVLLIDYCRQESLTHFVDNERNTTFAQCDPTNVSAVSRTFDQFCKKVGAIDALVCTVQSLSDTSSIESFDAFRKAFELDFFSNLIPVKVALKRMIPTVSGRIILLSSISGLCTYSGLNAYPPARWALTSLCRSLRAELDPYHISVDVLFLRTTNNEYSKSFLYKQGIDPLVVARSVVELLQNPRNSNHVIPKRYSLLYQFERLVPSFLDRKYGLGSRTKRMKKSSSRSVESVLITGASSGLGKDLAILYSKIAKCLYLIARNHKSLLRTKNDIQQRSDCAVHLICLDVTDEQKLKTIAKQIECVDMLVNNAGSSIVGTVTDVPVGLYRESFATNFLAAVQLTSEFLRKSNKPSKIINILSTTAIAGRRNQSCYSAAKAALWAYTRSLRRSFGSEIQVVEVLASTFSSNFDKNTVRIEADSDSRHQGTRVTAQKAPSGKKPTSMEVAKAIEKAIREGREIVFVPFKARLFMILEASVPSLFRILFG